MSGKRKKIAAVAVFVAIFVFLSLPIGVSRSVKTAVTTLFSPLFSVTRSIGQKVADIWDAAFHSNNIVRENRQKQRENSRLRAELALAREKIRELGSLRSQLQALAESGFELIPASVLVREPDSWYQTLLINRGAKHGVGMKMPVVQGENLVGRVIEVGGLWSRVRLVLDPQSAIHGMTLDGEVEGLIVGAGPGALKMTLIKHNARLKVGEVVVTAYLGKVLTENESPMPRGLTIGKIAGVSQEEEGLYQSATLEPAVNFRNLREVLVVVPK